MKTKSDIKLKADRQHVEAVKFFFFPYIDMLQQTQLNNVAHHHSMSSEVLFTIAINCLLKKIKKIIDRKITMTDGMKITFALDDAEAVAFYRALIGLPIPGTEIYLQNIRNNWLDQLDTQLIDRKIYHTGQASEFQKTVKPSSGYFVD